MAVEIYYTRTGYERCGIEPYLEHVKQYLAGEMPVPVTYAQVRNLELTVDFTFSDELLKRFVDDIASVEKAYEVAVKFGFRWYSTGKQEGIFYQRRQDTRMAEKTDKLVKQKRNEVLEYLCPEQINKLRKVKLVWQNPNRERILGVYNQKGRMLFLGFTKY